MLTMDVNSPERQEAMGAAIAAICPLACIIYLEGDLGVGKTTLVRGFLRELGHQGSVKSPSYTLLELYEIAGRLYYHLDLYRLVDPEELEYLGIRDLLQEQAVLLVEWPDRGGGGLPKADLRVVIHYQGEGRRLNLHPVTEVGSRLIRELSRRLAGLS